MRFGLLMATGLLASVAPSTATVINFDTQAVERGGNLTGIPDSPLTIGAATFTGGELLSGEVGLNADQTGVYASEGLFGSGETNPLVITFSSPVNDFSVLVVNGDDVRTYTVSDNVGDSITQSLPSTGAVINYGGFVQGLGAATFSLSGNGLTTVDISSANADAWDFAIDNVSFTGAASIPEPDSVKLLALGLMVVLAACLKHAIDLLRRGHS
jgi:hypothetical protein